MKIYMLLALALLTIESKANVSRDAQSPDCVVKCWDNSRFVSTCDKETECLCEDNEFQSTVLQCLYSQCQTAQFGSALHFALSQCAGHETNGPVILPHLIRQQGLRKRTEYESMSGVTWIYGSASASMRHSTLHRSGSVSASVFSRPTRSASDSRSYAHGHRTVHSTQWPMARGLGEDNDKAEELVGVPFSL